MEEYWIVNPLLNTIQLYVLNSDGQYILQDVAKEKGQIRSVVIPAFHLDAATVFV
ncbi:hypothetical protein [Gracilibacillus alcaliphilus]|uniref:hypothetical protein n=1 Tax=Gracilibacillus alcaliphilus TaxID=1401441 RepID=UPI00308460A2|nr:Uma2 family endonuclease [Gracilibacillus alcaliphilus]